MVKKRLTDAVAGGDSKTELWRMRFATARMAYEDGNLREAERMLVRLEEPAEQLKERTFAVNTTRIGLGAVQLAGGRIKEAGKNIDRSLSELAGSPDPVLQELYAVALRFRAELLNEQKDERGAEQELKKAIAVLEKIGDDAAVQLAYTLCDLCGLYAVQGRFSEADTHMQRAARILMGTVGIEDKQFLRVCMLSNIFHADKADLANVIENEGIKMQDQFGAEHPTMVRALRRYVQELKKKGDTARIEAAKQTFKGFSKAAKS